ncbi:MAG TPA: excinuclease ABC subunit UvrA [Myxococcota bacterium]|nr:excinuclease ABC subunit UvrA [Myxococcota bacterium]HOH76315.1 excinuclease ABC subunit UvrA [Myxococcota bacterium]HPV02942.1 excinuclease ABC subunit UvrA [Myxococcota bacterium]
MDRIVVKGAREHNLRNVTVGIPKLRMVVFSGVSGSGKTSLAFDTVFAEGQRRYIESLSSYARLFLGQLEKPKYDSIQGLTPTIAIEQKSASSNPRSTVGTITEIHDYLRVLFARTGTQHCHMCGRPVSRQEPAQILREIMEMTGGSSDGTKVTILAPVARNRKGEYRDLFKSLEADGFVRVRIDGGLYRLDEVPQLDRNKKHDIDVVVDRIIVRPGGEARLTDSIETALKTGRGRVIIIPEAGAERIFSEHLACEECGVSFPELSPQLFSFNNPSGACPSCNGLGSSLSIDPAKVIPDPGLSIAEGAIEPWARAIEDGGLTGEILQSLARQHGIDLDRPFRDLSAEHRDIILFGDLDRIPVKWNSRSFNGSLTVRFEGVASMLLRRLRETKSDEMRSYYQQYLTDSPCEACHGRRLRPEALAVKVNGMTIDQMSMMPVERLIPAMTDRSGPSEAAAVTDELNREILSRLSLLKNLGLGYLDLARSGATLSGGEAQRIRLASQLGSELTGVTYILDEPSIGLHPRDNQKLINTLCRLRDLGNTVIVVEHDRDAIMAADHVIEFGPGAGRHGGEVTFEGTPSAMLESETSLTGAYLSGRKQIPVPASRRPASGFLTLRGASGHNLKEIDVDFPLGTFTVVSGVSGAGKSSLVTHTLSPAMQNRLNGSRLSCLPFAGIEGVELLDKIIVVNQEPIGRTPRSNPATYTKLFDHIRRLFAETREARVYGYQPGRFSFNVKGGRCEKCQGAGSIRVEMHFLPDVFVTCGECGGKRFNEATLRVRFRDLSIAEVLELPVDEAAAVFKNSGPISRILSTLQEVGLGYITLGQPSTTLSGGEAQRIKLSRELARMATGRTLYIMDEPSTGLHFDDVAKLLKVVDSLVDRGNTVLMIEHNLEILKVADHIIDLGPEGGERGGMVIGCGTPEQLASNPQSFTGKSLLELLGA